MKNHVKKLFSKDDLAAITSAIHSAEKTTSGEIRVSVRQRRKWRERKLSLEQIARKEFHTLGMTKKEERTGILIFLLVADRQFYVLADEGVHGKVEESRWKAVADGMSAHFSSRNFRQGIIHGVEEVGKVLSQNFPAHKGSKDELSDEVHVS